MNAENLVQIELFGVSSTRTKDTRLAAPNGGYARAASGSSHAARSRATPQVPSLPTTRRRATVAPLSHHDHGSGATTAPDPMTRVPGEPAK
jgi:hypothetical protein